MKWLGTMTTKQLGDAYYASLDESYDKRKEEEVLDRYKRMKRLRNYQKETRMLKRYLEL